MIRDDPGRWQWCGIDIALILEEGYVIEITDCIGRIGRSHVEKWIDTALMATKGHFHCELGLDRCGVHLASCPDEFIPSTTGATVWLTDLVITEFLGDVVTGVGKT